MRMMTDAEQRPNDVLSTASRVAARFGDDGQCFDDREGYDFDFVCREERGVHVVGDEGRDALRYNFPDGSALIVAGDGWDHAIPGSHERCMCWVGADRGRHDERCEYGEGAA